MRLRMPLPALVLAWLLFGCDDGQRVIKAGGEGMTCRERAVLAIHQSKADGLTCSQARARVGAILTEPECAGVTATLTCTDGGTDAAR